MRFIKSELITSVGTTPALLNSKLAATALDTSCTILRITQPAASTQWRIAIQAAAPSANTDMDPIDGAQWYQQRVTDTARYDANFYVAADATVTLRVTQFADA